MPITDKQLQNLQPAKKGEVRNPKGKDKGTLNSKTRLRRFLSINQEKENDITGEIEDLTVAEQMDLKQIVKALKGDLFAYREILDRIEGRASQSVDHTTNGKDMQPHSFVFISADKLTDEQIEQYISNKNTVDNNEVAQRDDGGVSIQGL